MVIDPDYLEQLRIQAAEVRADLEEREANNRSTGFLDPIAEHDAIMEATRPARQRAAPELIHKTNMNARVLPNDDDGNGDDPIIPPTFTDEQMDLIATVLAEQSMQVQARIDDAVAPLNQRIVALEAQISTLMSMLNDSNRSIETPKLVHVR
jgi:hypothetical protein